MAAQVQRRRHAFSRAGAGYLGGKYDGKYRRIFHDRRWREDAAFVDACLALYELRRAELEPLLPVLGQLDLRQQLADLANCAAVR